MKNRSVGIIVPDVGIAYWPVCIPEKSVDLSKWAVIACDQFTADAGYWKDVEKYVGNAPSTLKCIFPEVYLGKDDEERITSIHNNMNRYIEDGILRELPPGCIWTERELSSSNIRSGLVLAVDLEKYDFTPGSKAHIKATEKTILERIPPRKHIRENAPLEFPHILVLYSDPEKEIEAFCRNLKDEKRAEELYSAPLMKGGGKVSGYFISKTSDLDILSEKFMNLIPENMEDILFAVGDGNHSLATAKAIWDELKSGLKENDYITHPARYALVEMINLFDSGLNFEPIHRVIFDTDPETIISLLEKTPGVTLTKIESNEVQLFRDASADRFESVIIHPSGAVRLSFSSPDSLLPVGTLQGILDSIEFEGELDFIHGFDETVKFGREPGNMAFLTPAIDPGVLFECVKKEGVLPRKSFSLGHAEDKRYYLEAKRI